MIIINGDDNDYHNDNDDNDKTSPTVNIAWLALFLGQAVSLKIPLLYALNFLFTWTDMAT